MAGEYNRQVIHRAFRYRLYPTPEQAEAFDRAAGVVRFVYNLAWEQRHTWGRRHRINFASQCRELTVLREQVDWIAAVSCTAHTQALRDLDRAFTNFFKGRKHYPTPRRRGENDSFRFKGSEVHRKRQSDRWSVALLPRIGWVKFRDTRPMAGRCLNVTVKRGALGWFASFTCEIEHEAIPTSLPAVGIDRGVANTLALSTGELLSLPDLSTIDRQHKRAQRVLARRKKGSKRRLRQLRRCARLSAKRARIRRDWHHKTSTTIARRFGHVALEDLNVQGMTAKGRGKRGLNRVILNQGWGAFEVLLAYKLEERGGTLDKVPAAYTSLTCSECGTVDKQSRESQSVFACQSCGHTMHADTNAAINIRRRSTALQRAEASGYGAVETRTTHAALAA